jgi:hypothetical protein
MVTAWGRLITSNAGQRALVRIKSIRHSGKPLARAKVG